MSSRESRTVITVATAVRRSGLRREVVLECVERRLVEEPLTTADLLELRRIRRLTELGVNLPGIEVILHMRRRILALQAHLYGGREGWDRDLEAHWQRLLTWTPDE